jgi:hypothetical protein
MMRSHFQMLWQPTHEVAVVVFGSTGKMDTAPAVSSVKTRAHRSSGTRNGVHDEMVADGDDSSYRHVSVQHPLQTLSQDYLATFADIERQAW